jgi:hypothetical protein
MKTLRTLLSVLACVAILGLGASANAAIPRLLNFQGRLTDAAGTPLSGTYGVTFRVWTASSGGSACFTENQTVAVNAGLFNVMVGGVTSGGISTACTFTAPYYLDLQVGTDEPMAPRLALTPAAYSFNADLLDGVDSTALAARDPGTGNLSVDGKLGIGTSSPAQRIDVAGNVKGTALCMGSTCKAAWPTGTVTSISAGTAIIASPNPITTTGTLSVDTSIMQSRVSGTCTGAIRVVNANGTVSCATVPGTGICYYKNKTFTAGAPCYLGSSGTSPFYTYYYAICNSDGSWSNYSSSSYPGYPSCG